jgi:predicted deacylase
MALDYSRSQIAEATARQAVSASADYPVDLPAAREARHRHEEQAMRGEFGGKVALVPGAGSGMGRATAILLAKRGATVTLIGRRENKLQPGVIDTEMTQANAGEPTGQVHRHDRLGGLIHECRQVA